MVDYKHKNLVSALSLTSFLLLALGFYCSFTSASDTVCISLFAGCVIFDFASDFIGIRHIKELFHASLFSDAFMLLSFTLFVFGNTVIVWWLSVVCALITVYIDARAINDYNKKHTINF